MSKHIEALKHYAALAALSLTIHHQHWVLMGCILLLMITDVFTEAGE